MHITPEEYQSLPVSVQKKYFSSVERLRILQQTAVEKRSKQSLSPRQSSLDAIRPKTSHSSRTHSPRQSRKSSLVVPFVEDVNEDQALRFLALPDKVKRSHFSEVELVLLTESSQRVLGLSDDGRLPQWRYDNRSASVGSASSIDSMALEKDWPDEETDSVMSNELGGGSDPGFATPWGQHQHNAISCSAFAAASAIDLSQLGARKKSFSKKRAMSLAPLPLPPPTLLPAMPALPRQDTTRESEQDQVSSPAVGPRQTETQHYRDAEARSKLRTFLASPEKFDEALEFGFPAERPERNKSTSTRGTPAALDLDDADDDDLSGPPSMASPSSTDSTAFSSATANPTAVDSGVTLPLPMMKGNVRSLTPDLDGREMTLRLTLTRRDLRAPEEELYAFQRSQVSGVDVETADPLALDSLEICDDHSGNHGAFAINNNRTPKRGFMKVWSSIRKR
ncbi:hypothetical protein Slin15195_G002960 [Septoria linicola]|uniref:Uncharacterized protein n=1 Tax=Septoria linicola TaxID=215465 RepID=A0A9Q9AJ04_9PEZI|nr:hypothetical protein Slin14017_G002980 [Septoria linicola]USW46977.1 hypothetical protein Slin15195_G002960 [Septoria linicola]